MSNLADKALAWIEHHWAQIKTSKAFNNLETNIENLGGVSWAYIKTNGLEDLYSIALMLVAAAVPGASWVGVIAAVKAKAITDGVKLIEGAEGVVAAQAQADLIAAGKLPAPSK